MQVSVLWNVWIVQPNEKHGELIFVGFRDCECRAEEFSTEIRKMMDDIIEELDESVKKTYEKFGYIPSLVIEMKKIDIK